MSKKNKPQDVQKVAPKDAPAQQGPIKGKDAPKLKVQETPKQAPAPWRHISLATDGAKVEIRSCEVSALELNMIGQLLQAQANQLMTAAAG